MGLQAIYSLPLEPKEMLAVRALYRVVMPAAGDAEEVAKGIARRHSTKRPDGKEIVPAGTPAFDAFMRETREFNELAAVVELPEATISYSALLEAMGGRMSAQLLDQLESVLDGIPG